MLFGGCRFEQCVELEVCVLLCECLHHLGGSLDGEDFYYIAWRGQWASLNCVCCCLGRDDRL